MHCHVGGCKIKMIKYPDISIDNRMRLLELPTGKVRAVLDSDAYNEIDDQFALAYALLAKDKIDLQAVYAAPFFNKRSNGPGDGMLKSYDEIIRIMDLMQIKSERWVFKGSENYLPNPETPVESDSARDLITKALAANDAPLYVMAIGAPTNVASAILLEPDIIDRIVVVWLGGHPHYNGSCREFNLMQDINASRVLFDSGVPLIQIPCLNVAEHLRTTIHEMKVHLSNKNRLCDYLLSIYKEYVSDGMPTRSKVIWDISVVAFLINPTEVFFKTSLVNSPILTNQLNYRLDSARHFIRIVDRLDRDHIFEDMFKRLGGQ